jgi:ADP-ribose pyrophosphatase YjhB (NUDIX family)
VFIATADGQPVAADDARNAGIFTRNNLPELAFDHAVILQDYFRYKDTGVLPS